MTDLISNLDYNLAESIIRIQLINDNHLLLDSTLNTIEDTSLMLENPEIDLNPMRTQIFFIKPAFLMNPTEPYLKDLSKDIEEYQEAYENLCTQINSFTVEVSNSLKILYKPSNDLKIEISRILEQFEETIKNLCVPLISEREGLDTININNLSEKQKFEINEDKMTIIYQIDEFKKESKKLNKRYNDLFNQMSEAVELTLIHDLNIVSALRFQKRNIEPCSLY